MKLRRPKNRDFLTLHLGLCALALASPTALSQTIDAKQMAAQVCAPCHGRDGNSTNPRFPSLAQQGAGYLSDQLSQFAAQGGRRASGVMGAIAVNLTPPEMRVLAAYFSHQSLTVPHTTEPWPTKGESIYRDGVPDRHVPACASCHGNRGEGLPISFPRLAGQHAEYVLLQLRDFRSGARQSDPDRMMHNLTLKLTDQEMGAVAEYVARLY